MIRKKGKTISFDAMVKFFMQNYNIPTKKDVDKLMTKLDRIENLLRSSASLGPYPVKNRVSSRKTALAAIVLYVEETECCRTAITLNRQSVISGRACDRDVCCDDEGCWAELAAVQTSIEQRETDRLVSCEQCR